jgi:cytoskeletal protein CcmA (bactofilin family)
MTTMQSGPENVEKQMITVMANDLQIKGSITFKTSLMIKGSLEGEIISEGTLVVGETAKINAAITTQSLVSHGNIEGDVVASEQVVLKSTAVHSGKITTPNIIVESGSIFNGSCVMAREKPEPPQEKAAVEEIAASNSDLSQESLEEKTEESGEMHGQDTETAEEGDTSAPSETKAGQFGFSWTGGPNGRKEY